MKNLNAKLAMIAITLLSTGCLGFVPKTWMTFPDNKDLNEALRIEEKVDVSDFGFDSFIPVNSGIYLYGPKDLMASAADMALTVEELFNARKLTTFDQIIQEFDQYHLPCTENENQLICDYYVIRSQIPHGGGRSYTGRRSDSYALINFTFAISEKKVQVGYSDQSCDVVYDEYNQVVSYAQINIEIRKRGFVTIYNTMFWSTNPPYVRNIFIPPKRVFGTWYDPEYLDAKIQKCLDSDLYKTIQHYFKTYYPKKYHKAHLGGAEPE